MLQVDEDQSWVARALCANEEPDALFVQGAGQRQVRLRCMQCEVRLECLADALQSEANFGVWGGLTERERRAMLRHYADVDDWGEWLSTSDDPLAQEIRSPKVPRVLAHVRG
ncbi:WhiB family transcriptional regulator [Schaalia sp. 19OD2882]|uniref:WhiB family transcriptional regulator n=1 Tax=Schaalia sp. 19OD2882 TaxID=2794089 RepID=UPI001C1F01F5|nr:WhiB family transcriptional regulator [Schaalia sp. 19OD2882]QWW19712.1 WhiB family transcriptional regulator [Schaalia sp. 19OD2882]